MILKENGAAQTKKPKRRTTAVVRRDGREPLGLGSAVGAMMTERSLVAPAVSGSVLAQFDPILAVAAPELTGRVQAVAFDAHRPLGRRPRSPGSRHEAAQGTSSRVSDTGRSGGRVRAGQDAEVALAAGAADEGGVAH
ncbi:hypothetical protein GCM10012285_28400 [Streptomyces kronopolitis]|uniref:Uncharacterized protein n=1 Tax=Streptomyces kronopolitis TaxID=1612435 RepID=A0ABQ2JDY1_9ACTN|nr:hypothetical protein [Streptomyces kronopolitis]GGN45075.1 hypothetical protein GCM10012285_28400 [Streptomyces kronopolitis]